MAAIRDGVTDLAELRTIEDCALSDEELHRVVMATAREFDAARKAMMDHPPSDEELLDYHGWDDYQDREPGTQSSRAWQMVFEVRAEEFRLERERQEQERREHAREAAQRSPYAGLFTGTDRLAAGMAELARLTRSRPASSEYLTQGRRLNFPLSDIAARRYDEIRADDERAQQRQQDYENELERLETEHGEIARPTGWLWAAVAILAFFAVVGIGLPVGLMSRGPTHLNAVSWVVWFFLPALAALLGFIVLYLKQLTKKDPSGKPS